MSRRVVLAVIAVAVSVLLLGASRQRAVRPVAHPVTGPTFSKEVVRIFQESCQSCHHPGDIAPFSLMDYASAKSHAAQIKLMTQTHQMPPWKPTAGCGDFADPRTISQDAIDMIAKWANNGAPEGDRADLPTPLDFSSGWTLGQPDLVLSYPETFTPPAEGDMYRCFPLPTNVTSDKTYVSAIDIHPGDRKTVHHVIAFIDKGDESVRLDSADPAPGYKCFGGPGFAITDSAAATLGGWAPGTIAARFPEEVGFWLPPKSRVVLQVHYHSHDGTPQPDKTEIGIYYAKKPPQKLLRMLPLINPDFTIPPNDPNYKVTASFMTTFPIPPLHVWGIYPHMHLLGRSMNVQASLPTGETKCLINIDDWDFNWQGLYRYKDPVAIPTNTILSLEAHYDNSSDNLRNPNSPPRAVSWGEQTTDEMCIAFIAFTLDTENLPASGAVEAKWVPQIPNWR
ncbi:MAG TPA: ascorbate-dependent monooxygenase [Thermoanaerobaculia bacterium]